MNRLWQVFVDSRMLQSSKFRAFVVGVVIWLLSEVGVEIDPDALDRILMFIASYMGAQGIADFGKEGRKFFTEYLKQSK